MEQKLPFYSKISYYIFLSKMEASVPFYSKIYNMIFFSNEKLTAEEIYQKAKAEHKPILL